MLTKLENLLINLEDSIFNLIKDKLDRKQIRTFTIDETLLLMNVNLSINKEVVTNYNEHFPIYCKDIDIVNLIVKYIETCSKIVSYHQKDDKGIQELDYHPKYDIKSLIESCNKPIFFVGHSRASCCAIIILFELRRSCDCLSLNLYIK